MGSARVVQLRRRTVLTAALAAGFAGLALHEHEPASERRAQVFHVPHQDDEVLTLGAPLAEAIAAGSDVHVVLLTQGESSWVRTSLVAEGWLADDREVFRAARDREFRAALKVLGVPWRNVHFGGLPDVASAGGIAEVIHRSVVRWPQAVHHTLSWRDTHPDHQNAGLALNQEWVTNPRLSVRFWQFPVHSVEHPIGATVVPTPPAVFDAAAEYAVWAPTNEPPERSRSVDHRAAGRYAIGRRSVPTAFAALHGHGSWFRWHDPSTTPVPPEAHLGYELRHAPLSALRSSG